MKKYFRIIILLVFTLALTNIVLAGDIITISSPYSTNDECEQMKNCFNLGYEFGYSSNTKGCIGSIKTNLKTFSRSSCYSKNISNKNGTQQIKYVYNVCNSGINCITGDTKMGIGNNSKLTASNNEDILYKRVLDSLLEKVNLKRSEKNDVDYEKFLNETIDYVNKLLEKDIYKNDIKTAKMINYLQTGLTEIKQEFENAKNESNVYSLLCDLGSCDKNNFVTTNVMTNTGTETINTNPNHWSNYIISKYDKKCKNTNTVDQNKYKSFYSLDKMDNSNYITSLKRALDISFLKKYSWSDYYEIKLPNYLIPRKNPWQVESCDLNKTDGQGIDFYGKFFVPPYSAIPLS